MYSKPFHCILKLSKDQYYFAHIINIWVTFIKNDFLSNWSGFSVKAVWYAQFGVGLELNPSSPIFEFGCPSEMEFEFQT